MVLRDHGISEIRALELMNEHYNRFPTCDPLWEIDGVNGLRQKVANAYNYASLNAPGERTAEAEFADDNPFPRGGARTGQGRAQGSGGESQGGIHNHECSC